MDSACQNLPVVKISLNSIKNWPRQSKKCCIFGARLSDFSRFECKNSKKSVKIEKTMSTCHQNNEICDNFAIVYHM